MAGKVVQIASGINHAAFLFDDGTVKTCGLNSNGQLGLGHKVNLSTPTLVAGLAGVKHVECGTTSTAFILDDSKMKGCGYTPADFLGIGTSERTVPILSSVSNVKEARLQDSFGVILLNDGNCMVCGSNSCGQLGMGDTTNKLSLVSNIFINNILHVGGRSSTVKTVFHLNDGTVRMCGSNSPNTFGTGTPSGNVVYPSVVSGISELKQIVASSVLSACLLNDGTVKVCGSISYNDTLRPEFTALSRVENVKQLACGTNHLVCLLNDGTVKVCGDGYCGQLGIGKTTGYVAPTLIPGLNNVAKVVARGLDTYFIMNDGTVKACGQNKYGELGLGDTVQRNTPTLVESLIPPQTAFYIYLSNNIAYAEENNALKEVAADYSSLDAAAQKTAFLKGSAELSSVEKITELETPQILIYSTDAAMAKPVCTVTGVPKSYLHKSQMLDLTAYGAVEQVAVDVTCSGGGSVKLLASTDGEVYRTLKNGVWETVDATDAVAVASSGMESSALSDITEQQWADLLDGQNKIGFLCLLDVTASSDTCEVKSITVHAKDADGDVWSLAVPGVDYTYKYTAKTNMQMTFLKAGEYMVNYQR